jgi:uncharacterized RDD family membrane protein YckC
MNGEQGKGMDWQSELKARLEAYEKRTGRKISGKSPEENPGEEDSVIKGDVESDSDLGREHEAVTESGEKPGTESSSHRKEKDGTDNKRKEPSVEPDFLAVLDGIDDREEDEYSFLFRERLRRDTDPEFEEESPMSMEPWDYPDEEDLEPEEDVDISVGEKMLDEPIVKVVNIDEFRLDNGFEDPAIQGEETGSPEIEMDSDSEEDISKEIVVSRLLGGTVDLIMALVISAGFMEIVVWKLSLNFFEIRTLQWTGILALVFFLFNSLYFLTSIQRTPGMILAELKLKRSRGGGEPSFLPVLVRTLAFFPSALSVTGLVWAFFDHQARCLHDIISGTKVVSTRWPKV